VLVTIRSSVGHSFRRNSNYPGHRVPLGDCESGGTLAQGLGASVGWTAMAREQLAGLPGHEPAEQGGDGPLSRSECKYDRSHSVLCAETLFERDNQSRSNANRSRSALMWVAPRPWPVADLPGSFLRIWICCSRVRARQSVHAVARDVRATRGRRRVGFGRSCRHRG
jgi:hypothetical protein